MGEVYQTPWEYDAAPFQITDDIWYVGNASVSAHLVDTGEGLILFDTTYPQTAYLLLESIRRCGFDPADIRYILHTHVHYDHIGATRLMQEKYGCKTFLGEGDAFIIRDRTELTWHSEYGLPFHETFEPDVLLKDGDVVQLGRARIRCIASPGHTPGNMTFLWETSWQGKKYSAALSGGYHPNTAASAYLKKYSLPNWREGYAYTFERLAALSPDIMLGSHPGFNNSFEKAARLSPTANPFIDPGAWAASLNRGQEIFDALCAADPLE